MAGTPPDAQDGDAVVGLQLEVLGGAPASGPQGTKVCFGILAYQKEAEIFYTGFRVQVAVAGLIVTNFMVNIVQKQVDPKDDMTDIFSPFETFFNLVFFAELIVNMYSTWFFKFWKNGWNRFDFLVVSVGMLDTCQVDIPEQLKFLRMLRAFRVFRLFARVESLNKIIVSLVHAVPGVANAFLIMTIVMAIYAILAVDLYQDVGMLYNVDGTVSCVSDTFISGRGRCVGEEYFGTFLASLYSLFQVLTGDSWSEAIARPVMLLHPYSGPLFFLSFIILNAVVLINVVVAVLVDKIMNPDEDPKKEDLDAVVSEGTSFEDPQAAAKAIAADGASGTLVADPASAEDRPAGEGANANAGGNAGADASAGGESGAAALKLRVSGLTGDSARLREEVTQVSAALRSGLTRTRTDLGGLQAKLDAVLSALREAQPRGCTESPASTWRASDVASLWQGGEVTASI